MIVFWWHVLFEFDLMLHFFLEAYRGGMKGRRGGWGAKSMEARAFSKKSIARTSELPTNGGGREPKRRKSKIDKYKLNTGYKLNPVLYNFTIFFLWKVFGSKMFSSDAISTNREVKRLNAIGHTQELLFPTNNNYQKDVVKSSKNNSITCHHQYAYRWQLILECSRLKRIRCLIMYLALKHPYLSIIGPATQLKRFVSKPKWPNNPKTFHSRNYRLLGRKLRQRIPS